MALESLRVLLEIVEAQANLPHLQRIALVVAAGQIAELVVAVVQAVAAEPAHQAVLELLDKAQLEALVLHLLAAAGAAPVQQAARHRQTLVATAEMEVQIL